jgi:hypothetical protein
VHSPPELRPMRQQLILMGSRLAGISFATLLGYMITAQSGATHNPPVWPYVLCGGLTLLGGTLSIVGQVRPPRRRSHDTLDPQEQKGNQPTPNPISENAGQHEPPVPRTRGAG